MIKTCSTTLVKNRPIEEGLPYFSGVIENIELRVREGHFTIDNRKRIEDFRKLAKKYRVSVISLHQTMKSQGIPIDISSQDRWIRKFSVRDTEKTIIAANILGAKRIVIHPSDVIEQDEFETREKMLLSSLEEIITTADEYNVKIFIENLRNGKMGNSLNWLLSLKERFMNSIDICFDTGHWLLSQKDNKNFNKFNHYHIHDNLGKRDEHLFPGKGIFPWDKIKFPKGSVVVYELMPEDDPRNTLRKIKEDER